MMRPYMETDLIMFSARQTTIFDLLEPRTFAYMTKLDLIDGRREAPPMRYWYSRIDTRSSTIASLYLEPGTPLKMILSDSVLKKKLILLNASEEHPQGVGYTVEDWPLIHNTAYAVASDMWRLLDPRIENLESHGIVDEKIRSLQKEGTDALARAKKALEEYRYDRFSEATDRSWALASRVYDQVEKTQKDVLFGVLFYIALFVPFAFCMERLLFFLHQHLQKDRGLSGHPDGADRGHLQRASGLSAGLQPHGGDPGLSSSSGFRPWSLSSYSSGSKTR